MRGKQGKSDPTPSEATAKISRHKLDVTNPANNQRGGNTSGQNRIRGIFTRSKVNDVQERGGNRSW